MTKLLSEILKPNDGGLELDDVTNKYDKGKVSPTAKHWGYHLIVDCSSCNHDVDNPKQVGKFLVETVKALKMKAIGDPIIVQFKAPANNRGTTGVQIIDTSSITFHSDDEIWAAYIDVFSCAEFKPNTIIPIIKRYFQPKHMAQLFLYRDASKKWPESKKSKFR